MDTKAHPPHPPASPASGGRVRPPKTFHAELTADLRAPALVRRRLRSWLRELGFPPHDQDDIVLAVSEAVSNTAEHAYPNGRPGEVAVHGVRTREGGETQRVIITVADRGTWHDPPLDQENRRRGLPMMRALTDALQLDISVAGTYVKLTSKPARPLGKQT